MTDPPFGFGPPRDRGGSGDDPGGSPDPMGPLGDPQQFADALRQFADLMSWQGGPVNWDLAKNVARHAVAAQGDASILAPQAQEVAEALRLADLWLDDVTTFPSGVRTSRAWSRSEWVEATLPVWSKLCDPIAAKAVETMSGAITAGTETLGSETLGGELAGSEVPEDLRAQLHAMAGPMLGLVRQVGGLVVASQIGRAVGADRKSTR